MATFFDVLAIGELNPDLILSGFGVEGPVLGTEQVFERQALTLGSSTAIACVLMQRLGLRTAMSATVGDDDYGTFCRDVLRANGVDISGVISVPGRPTGITISLSYPSDRMLLTRYGTMETFSIADIDPDLLNNARHLHVGSFFIQSGLQHDLPDLFQAARNRGQTTSLDLGWDPAEKWDTTILKTLLPYVSVVFPNRVELAAVTGTDEIDDGLSRLHEFGAYEIALKLGSSGSIWSSESTALHHEGYSINVVDTTGAGDAFNAGFLSGWLDAGEPLHCLSLGNACGALTASSLGGIGGVEDMTKLQAFLRNAFSS